MMKCLEELDAAEDSDDDPDYTEHNNDIDDNNTGNIKTNTSQTVECIWIIFIQK